MWQRLVITTLLLLIVAWVDAQKDGRYRAPSTTARARIAEGRYSGASDGRYRPANNGQYRSGNDGRYVHKDVKYKHDDRSGGQYVGGAGPGNGRGGGAGGGGGGGSGGGGGGGGAASGGKARAGAGAAVRKTVAGAGLGALIGGRANAIPNTNANAGRKVVSGKGTGEGGNGWKIIRQVEKSEQDGYNYLYETENGILAEESGRIEKLNADADGLRSQGFFEYTGPDGVLYRVDYVADDNGFVARGDHVPTTPPHVEKLLAYLKANAVAQKK